MTDSIKDIDDLFSMFHDCEIVELKLDHNILTMEVLLPWGEIWNIEDFKMTFKFEGCTSLRCRYSKGGKNPSTEHSSSDPFEIEKLQLEVQRHNFMEPNKFILYCNSSSPSDSIIGVIEYGKLELTATDYHIFDNEMNEVTLDKMKTWATEWWDSIQDMWDKPKEKE